MGKRYFCEVCDKTFADNPTNRRNHMKGLTHQRLRQQHYDSFRNAGAVLAEELAKNPCRKFAQSGHCDFGDSCRFGHLTEERKRELEQRVLEEKARKAKKRSGEERPLSEWLSKRSRRRKDGAQDSAKDTATPLPSHPLPESLMNIHNLPPSLLPPTSGADAGLPVLEWG